jgi:tetratricopeptide (TPR) repeat protein
MRKLGLLLLLVMGVGLVCTSPTRAEEELKPISAAVAEARVAEVRDAITEVLWIGIEGYWHEGQWEDCLRLNQEIIALDPQFVEAYTSAAWLLWSYDRDQEAVAMYQQGIAANPDSHELYFDFGFYYRNRKQLDKAVEMLRKAVELGIDRGKQHLLPNTLEEAGRKKEALAEWRKLLKRFPNDPVAKHKSERLERELKK